MTRLGLSLLFVPKLRGTFPVSQPTGVTFSTGKAKKHDGLRRLKMFSTHHSFPNPVIFTNQLPDFHFWVLRSFQTHMKMNTCGLCNMLYKAADTFLLLSFRKPLWKRHLRLRFCADPSVYDLQPHTFNTSNQLSHSAGLGIHYPAKTSPAMPEKYHEWRRVEKSNSSPDLQLNRNFTEGKKLPYKGAPNLACIVCRCMCVCRFVRHTNWGERAHTHTHSRSLQATVNQSSWHRKPRSRIHKAVTFH